MALGTQMLERQADTLSTAEKIALLPPEQRAAALDGFSDDEYSKLLYDWDFWARPAQKTPPGAWVIWLLLSGRGFGKSRTGAEQTLKWKREGFGTFALIAQTPAEARDVMVEGPAGIMACSPPWDKPSYEPSKRRLTWNNGATAIIFSGENPEMLRGPQQEKAWVDELAKYRYPQETWDNLMMGMRMGTSPQVVVTTTPKPIPLIKALVQDPTVVVTRGSTYSNIANLSDVFLNVVVQKYENTRLGRQELYGEILDDNPRALWQRAQLERNRVLVAPELRRIVVALDPAATSKESSDETGMIVAGLGTDSRGYVLADSTVKATPEVWGKTAIVEYYKWQADKIIGEANNGGEMIEYVLRSIDLNVPYKSVYATRNKQTRAEPISSLYEQGRVSHVGYLSDLEDELCEWVPGDKSPNRLDACVWALTELMMGERDPSVRSLSRSQVRAKIASGAVAARPRTMSDMTELQRFLTGG